MNINLAFPAAVNNVAAKQTDGGRHLGLCVTKDSRDGHLIGSSFAGEGVPKPQRSLVRCLGLPVDVSEKCLKWRSAKQRWQTRW
jgi:hypothetical protein